MSHHGFLGQPAVADCVEACARELIGLALWDGEAYNSARLPATADAGLVAFFSSGVGVEPSAGALAILGSWGGTLGRCACHIRELGWDPRQVRLPY